MRSLLTATLFFISSHGDSSADVSGSSASSVDWNQYDMSSYYSDNCASILASTTTAPATDASGTLGSSSSSASSASSSSSSSSADIVTGVAAEASGDSSSHHYHHHYYGGGGFDYKKYMNQYGSGYGGGSASGTFGTSGSGYENQFKKYFGKYYSGSNGPGSYDNNNDGPNGQHKTQVVMCVCTKNSTNAKTGHMDQDAYSKCVNKAYGNNKEHWDNEWHQYMNQYRKDQSSLSSVEGSNTGSAGSTGTGGTSGSDTAAIDAKDTDAAVGGGESSLGSGTNTLDDGIEENSGHHHYNKMKNDKYNQALDYEAESGLTNSDDNDINTRHKKKSSISHSQYMEYLAIFLIFIGVISFIAVGVHCVRYTYKSYRLRNYEQIGANSKKIKNTQQKQQQHHKRIRLPRRTKTRNNNNNIKNTVDYGTEHENEVFTIGEV